jgi:hypothetical protein
LVVLKAPVSATVAVRAKIRTLWMAHDIANELWVRYRIQTPIALCVGDSAGPILVDCRTLQLAVEQGWGAASNADEPAPVFNPSTNIDLEVLDIINDIGPTFECEKHWLTTERIRNEIQRAN